MCIYILLMLCKIKLLGQKDVTINETATGGKQIHQLNSDIKFETLCLPAVSQICNLIGTPSKFMSFCLKSMPRIESNHIKKNKHR